jgi:hypothetical protein
LNVFHISSMCVTCLTYPILHDLGRQAISCSLMVSHIVRTLNHVTSWNEIVE